MALLFLVTLFKEDPVYLHITDTSRHSLQVLSFIKVCGLIGVPSDSH